MEQRGDISVIYKALSSSHWKTPYMLGWETDFAQEWDLEVWHRNSSRVYKGVLNTALVEVNVKVMTRWYLVPFKLAKLYPTASPLCFRGCDMLHVWWDCPKFRGFWNKIFSLIQKITGLPIAMSSLVATQLSSRICFQKHATSHLLHSPWSQTDHRSFLKESLHFCPDGKEESLLDHDTGEDGQCAFGFYSEMLTL